MYFFLSNCSARAKESIGQKHSGQGWFTPGYSAARRHDSVVYPPGFLADLHRGFPQTFRRAFPSAPPGLPSNLLQNEKGEWRSTQAKGLTQQTLSEKIGVSGRVIAYYESETDYPPAHLIVPLAQALEVTTDELLGVSGSKEDLDPQNAALWRKLKVIEKLPPKDQKAVLHYINMIIKARGINQKAG